MPNYLLIIRYSSDTERKRIEYVLSSFSNRMTIEKPSGTVVIVSGELNTIRELVEELYSKVFNDNIEVYRLEKIDMDMEPKRQVFIVKSSMRHDEVIGAISTVMASLKGALTSDVGGIRTYILNLRGGTVIARVSIAPDDNGSIVRVELEGYGRVFERARESLGKMLELVGEVKAE